MEKEIQLDSAMSLIQLKPWIQQKFFYSSGVTSPVTNAAMFIRKISKFPSNRQFMITIFNPYPAETESDKPLPPV